MWISERHRKRPRTYVALSGSLRINELIGKTMKPDTKFEQQIQRWVAAGVIDHAIAERILAFEAGQHRRASLRWPVILAMVFGGILLAAGVTLFVAAHWAELSPSERFALMILMVGVF